MAALFEEEVVGSVAEDLVFAVAQFAVGVEALEFGGGGFGRGLPILFQVQNLPDQPGEHVEETRVGSSSSFCLRDSGEKSPRNS